MFLPRLETFTPHKATAVGLHCSFHLTLHPSDVIKE